MTFVGRTIPVGDRSLDNRVPFNDLSHQWRQIKAKVVPDMDRLFEQGAFCLGPFVEAFEESVAGYLGAKYAIGVNSGTSALHLALIAAGVGPGDKVLVPSFTFIATVWAALYIGAIPVLCDVDAGSATIDLDDAERRIDGAVKAIIPVHLYGQPANMNAVTEFAASHELTIVEDAAQAIGARYSGNSVGTMGQFGCFSFYPSKNLGAAGEGGLVVTDDAAMARRIRAMRNHAQEERYIHAEVGFNYRMDGLQGLVLSQKLPLLDSWTQTRRNFANAYQERLSDLPLTLPRVVNGDHVYHLYVVQTNERDRLRDYLLAHGIETGLHYSVPLHRQPCLAHFSERHQSYPVAERYAKECLSLPLFIGMTETQLNLVCDAIRRFFGRP
jgi:dTDP-4-amino-4,6-dideoxygalactose transaminase